MTFIHTNDKAIALILKTLYTKFRVRRVREFLYEMET